MREHAGTRSAVVRAACVETNLKAAVQIDAWITQNAVVRVTRVETRVNIRR